MPDSRDTAVARALPALIEQAAHAQLVERAVRGVDVEQLKRQLNAQLMSEPFNDWGLVGAVIDMLGRRWRENPHAVVEALAIIDRAGRPAPPARKRRAAAKRSRPRHKRWHPKKPARNRGATR